MKVDQMRLQKLYPAIDADFRQRMELLLHGLPPVKEEEKVKRLTLRTAVVWVLLAALCMASASAVIHCGLDWYYRTRFTAYQEHEPAKHAAIMDHLQSGLAQTAVGDELICIQVTEASWTQEERLMVVALTAAPRNPELYELHPMWNLDADGEDRAEHWLWTPEGYGPAAQMITPGKQLLLLDTGSLFLDGHKVLGDGSSMDAFVGEDGGVHTVMEIRLDLLADDYEASMRREMTDHPEYAANIGERLAAGLEIRRMIETDEDGVLSFTLPFTVALYTDDDLQLYHGGHEGAITFEMKIR